MSLAQMLEGEAKMSSEAPAPSSGGMKSVVISLVVTVVFIAAAAGVAYALGWLP
jgi:flagellar basal body-associated protein FliL